MIETMDDILHPGNAARRDANFPDAPWDWSKDAASLAAADAGLVLNDEHWEVVHALQEYYARHEEGIRLRELCDALEERFHARGGMKHLYRLLPGGPIMQGCLLAGLEPPAADKGFGNVF